MSKNRVRATVRVIFDIEADSVWSGDTTWDQIGKQAEDSVRGMLSTNDCSIKAKDIKSVKFVGVYVWPENDEEARTK